MNALELTGRLTVATNPVLHGGGEISMQQVGGQLGKLWVCSKKSAVMVMASTCILGLSGCIQVTAPEKPIVIELNINIRQEVVYRLAADAAKTVKQNEGIF